MKQRTLYILNLFLVFVIGILVTYIYVTKIYSFEEVQTVYKGVMITENDTIQESIEKVYDSAVVVEVETNTVLGTGSGFVYKKDDSNGYIITNHHVVKGANKIYVINSAGVRSEAELLGSDEYSDIAVISIDVTNVLDVCEIGDSTSIKLGDTIFTVGSPLGSKYQGTVTKGIISGKDRQVTVNLTNGSFVVDVIQIDAAINPGNSGGPLVNINGQVIGVNSLKFVEDEIEGMGFAIPIEIVMSAVEKLEKGEQIERPQLGIQMLDIKDNGYLLSRYQIILDENINSGVAIISVENGKPAFNAGLKKGDIITAINDQVITDSAHLKYMLYKYSVGDSIVVKYNRNGKIYETTINLTL